MRVNLILLTTLAFSSLSLTACDQVGKLLGGCDAQYVAPNVAQLRADLTAAKAKWAAAGIHNYQFDYTQVPGGGTIRITVKDDSVAGTSPAAAPGVYTVDQLFGEIEYNLNHLSKCQSVTYTYDAQRGYPIQGNSVDHALPAKTGNFSNFKVENLTAQ